LQLEGLNIEYEQWVINAPNLRRLAIISKHDYGWHFSGLPLLEVVDMYGLESGHYADHRDFLMLISGLNQASKLKLSMPVNRFPSFNLILSICWSLAPSKNI
jgi:hypothetical protein